MRRVGGQHGSHADCDVGCDIDSEVTLLVRRNRGRHTGHIRTAGPTMLWVAMRYRMRYRDGIGGATSA
jgi:hypothetical protein